MVYFLRSRKSHAGPVVPITPERCAADFDFEMLLQKALADEDKWFQEASTPMPSTPAPDAVEPPIDSKAFPTVLSAGQKRSYEGVCRSDDVSRSHRRRRFRRTEGIVENGHLDHPDIFEELVRGSVPPKTELDLDHLPATSCGYQARPFKMKPGDEHWSGERLEALLADPKWSYVEWDGRTAMPGVSKNSVLFMACVGQPQDPTFTAACKRLFADFQREGQDVELQKDEGENRRGPFPALNIGVTHGKGTHCPINLHANKPNGNPAEHTIRVARLLQNQDLERIATFQSACFKMWAPRVYDHYQQMLRKLWRHSPHLRPNFVKSVFPSAALNFGSNVWTRRHRDSMNCPYGWCAITALGVFDQTRGGHLVLPDLKIIIEFPSGSTILIPSATLLHANVPVQEGDVRASFTQFCAGGLFRFVENGFMTEKKLREANKAEFGKAMALKKTRFARGLALLSRWDELVESLEASSC